MQVHGFAAVGQFSAPDPFINGVPVEGGVGVVKKEKQQVVLFGGQGDLLLPPPDFPGPGVHSYPCQGEGLLGFVKPAQDRFHPGQKLGHVKGLDNIVLGPQFQPLHPVGHRRPGGDEDHRKLQGLEVFQKGEAIGAGKHDVHQGQVIVPGSRQVRGLIPIWGMVAKIAGRL